MRNKIAYLLPMALLVLLTNTLPLMAATILAAKSPAPLLFADGDMAVMIILYLIQIGVTMAGTWMVFEKAGRPGWAAIVPIYGTIVFLEIIDRPWPHIFLLMIPLVNIVFIIIMAIEFANKFGHGGGFGVGLAFLSFIFMPILGFGSSEFEGSRPGGSRKKKKKKRSRDDDDEDEEERPRSRLKSRPRRDDDDEEENRSRRRSRRDDDEEEEEEDRPRRRPRRDDDDEPPPRPRPRPRRDD